MGACIGVQTEASREEGLTEGLCRGHSWGHPWSCPLFYTAQVPALVLEEKNTPPRGRARKDWEVGGLERRPDRSLQTIWGPVGWVGQYRNCSWALERPGP